MGDRYAYDGVGRYDSITLAFFEGVLNLCVGHEPGKSYYHIQEYTDDRIAACKSDSGQVADDGHPCFAATPVGLLQPGVGAFVPDDGLCEDLPRYTAHEEDGAVESNRQGFEVVFVYPGGAEWQEGDPEEQVQVCPEDLSVHAFDDVEEMVMVVPEYAYIYEAEQVGEGDGDHGAEGCPVRTMWGTDLKYHDRDDDGKYTVTECFEPVLVHAVKLLKGQELAFMNLNILRL